MKKETILILIKLLHTIIWAIMAVATFYILYAGIAKIFNIWLWISIGLLCVESLVLILNKWTCPLTPLAMNYTEDKKENFDIYLPRVLAKYNKLIFGSLFIIGLALVFMNVVNLPGIS